MLRFDLSRSILNKTLNHYKYFSKVVQSQQQVIIRNEAITAKEVRVVFQDPTTGKNEWKVLSKSEALALARSMSLDLILVDEKAEPPVCKLADYLKKVIENKEKKQQEGEAAKQNKSKPMKEMVVAAGIDPHDLETKLNKIKGFLEDGHAVKVLLSSKKRTKSTSPLLVPLDELLTKIVEQIGDLAGPLQHRRVYSIGRQDFILTPKSNKSPAPLGT